MRSRGQFPPDGVLVLAPFPYGIGHRDRLEQPRGVRVRRGSVNLLPGPDLDQLPEVHHPDAVRQVPHHRQVMRDQDIREVPFGLQLPHQVEHLRLDRHVERGDRLVGHDELRFQDQRPGEADPLSLPTRELVGVEGHSGLRQPDVGEQGADPGALLGPRSEVLRCQRLPDGVATLARGSRDA